MIVSLEVKVLYPAWWRIGEAQRRSCEADSGDCCSESGEMAELLWMLVYVLGIMATVMNLAAVGPGE